MCSRDNTGAGAGTRVERAPGGTGSRAETGAGSGTDSRARAGASIGAGAGVCSYDETGDGTSDGSKGETVAGTVGWLIII